MIRHSITAAIALGLLLSAAEALSLSHAENRPAFRISNGALRVDGSLVLEHFSIAQTNPAFLFFYIPDIGLVTVATDNFRGATLAGRFKDSQLRFEAKNSTFVLDSSGPIFPRGEMPAWVSVDERYALRTKAPMAGYGGDPNTPYHWPMYVDKN